MLGSMEHIGMEDIGGARMADVGSGGIFSTERKNQLNQAMSGSKDKLCGRIAETSLHQGFDQFLQDTSSTFDNANPLIH